MLDSVPSRIVEYSHGRPEFGSTEAPERFEHLSRVGNTILENIPHDIDVVVYVESDLIWDADTILRLMEKLTREIDIISPLVFAGEAFYDIYAFRKGGKRFSPFPPYHPKLKGLTEVDSVGSCLVMKGDVVRKVRIPPGQVLVGFCNAARKAGFRVWADPSEIVRHPA